jgi:hypothetical protein
MHNMWACRTGKLTPEVEAIVERIRSAAEAAPMRPQHGMIDGRFVGLLNTTNYLDAESTSTLGTLTFQQFHPRELKVLLLAEHNAVAACMRAS